MNSTLMFIFIASPLRFVGYEWFCRPKCQPGQLPRCHTVNIQFDLTLDVVSDSESGQEMAMMLTDDSSGLQRRIILLVLCKV